MPLARESRIESRPSDFFFEEVFFVVFFAVEDFFVVEVDFFAVVVFLAVEVFLAVVDFFAVVFFAEKEEDVPPVAARNAL